MSYQTSQGFFQLFAQGGPQNELYVIGGQVCNRVQSKQQTRGVRGHAPWENFDFGPFIRHNLVESGTVHN